MLYEVITVVAQNIEQNPDVAKAMQTYHSIVKEVDQAKAGYYPSVDATLGYGYEWTDKEQSYNFV